MTRDAPIIPPDILDEAASWLARLDAGLAADDGPAFQRWISADERHAAAWAEVAAGWHAFDETRRRGQSAKMIRELARRKLSRRWSRSLAIAGLAAAAVVVVMFTRPDPARGAISRIERRVLADGSVIELDRDARIEVDFQPARRSVRLLHGQALFTVAKNPARPFVVSTGNVDVQAVGTAFAVLAENNAVDVIVTEGKVAIEQTGAAKHASDAVLVGAGCRLVVPEAAQAGAPAVETLAPEELSRRLAWREPRVELAGTSLREAVELFNRESPIRLKIADARIERLRLSGVFRADDAEGFARLLAANYDVAAERRGEVIELRGK
ncbi:MAG: anti-FecI sigma factor, FecR [Verrucomicrobia bacterium]|nr:anti-FecI sigma factor, FecR [Verrucomicrobiota bacterium]